MDIFGTLSYKKNKLVPIGSPVQELAALYDKKQKDFDYVVDNTNLLDNALSNISYNDKDKQIVDDARKHFKDTISTFAKEGDLENKVLDVKKLANDLNNQFGLSAVQKAYQARQGYIQGLQSQYDKGDISRSDMQRAIGYSDFVNKGVQKGEDGYFESGYSGRGVLRKINFAEKVDDVIKGFESDKIILQNSKGQQLIKDPSGTGYLIAGTLEKVDRGEVVNAAKSYLENDPDFRDRVQEETFYDLHSLLTNKETGETREMTPADFENLVGTKVSSRIAEQLNIDNLNQLSSDNLKNIYQSIKGEQLSNEAIKLAVDKNSFEKYEAKYLQDWQLKEQMSAASQADVLIRDYSSLQTFNTQDRISTDDYKRTAQIYDGAKNNISQLQKELDNAKASKDPNLVADLENKLAAQKAIVNQVDSRMQYIAENTPEVQKYIDYIINDLTPVDTTGVPGMFVNTDNVNDLRIEGLNINKGELTSLINKQLAGNLKEADLTSYITGVDNDVRFNKSISNLKGAIQVAAHKLENALENNEVNYTEDYKWLNLPDLEPKAKRARPAYQLEYQAQQLTKDVNYFKNLVPTQSNESLVNLIEKEYDVKDKNNEILWNEGKIVPSIDSSIDFNTGDYRPTLVLQVPVMEGNNSKNKRTIQVPVFSGDDAYNNLYNDVLVDEKRALENKDVLTRNEKNTLDRINLSLYNQTSYGKNFDLLNLFNAKDGEIISTDISDDYEANIKVFKHNSPTNMRYYLMDGKGDNAKYYAQDKNGNVTTMDWQQLRSSKDFEAIGGNSPRDLKLQISKRVFNSNDDFRVDVKDTVDISSYFGQNVKDDVNPRLDIEAAESVKALKDMFPNLFLTDALRTNNSEIGAENSDHKYAKAIDLRLNEDAKKVVNLSDNAKRKLGIKTAEIHQNHVHIEFM